MNNDRTEISSIGKFALAEQLDQLLSSTQPSSLRTQGDDAIVVGYAEGRRTVATTKLLLEGIQFDLTYSPLRHLGYKAAVVAMADVFAMGAQPRQLTLTLGLSRRFSAEHIEELYSGFRLACDRYQADFVKGSINSSLTGLAISVTALGEGDAEALIYRSGAKSGDLVCCTGDLGSAYMGLQLLEREKRVFEGVDDDFAPDFAGREYILERQLKPELAVEMLVKLAERGVRPTSLMMLSDGLASEVLHLTKQSDVGVRIYEERLPIDHETAMMAEEMNLNPLSVALSGGEDYEFLFTIPLGQMDQAKDIEGLRILGHVTEAALGSTLVCRDGSEIELRDQGWVSQN